MLEKLHQIYLESANHYHRPMAKQGTKKGTTVSKTGTRKGTREGQKEGAFFLLPCCLHLAPRVIPCLVPFGHYVLNFWLPLFHEFSGTPSVSYVVPTGYQSRVVMGFVVGTFSWKADSRFLNAIT